MWRNSFIVLIFVWAFAIACRPVTNEDGASQESGGTMDSTTTSGDSTSYVSDSLSNGSPMLGEVGSSGDFMVSAAEAGLTEVKLAELALERSKNSRVKKFAQMMLKDHNDANTQLVKIADEANVELPSQLCMECEAKYNALAKNDGEAFDSVYTQLMIKDHKALLEKFVFQSNSGSIDDIKKWASDKVPVLQRHINAAMALDDSVTVHKGSK